MRRLLIANRGEIAVRIARTASERGLETRVVHAPEDAALAARIEAGGHVALEGSGAAAYLDVQQLVEIAKRSGCDAVHPGYGFLSENASFAEALGGAGITFVGPSPEALRLFGDKSAARDLARKLGVPVAPGTAAPSREEDVAELLASLGSGEAVMLKAAAGGGGRGMRVVRKPAELAKAFERCRSEALRSFGSDALYAERFLPAARHVEVQILGDGSGAVVHLHERECTLQRNHQKLIERAPAPHLDAAVREALLSAALEMARAAGYSGLGTFEFLVEPDGRFAFLEANPRLQVEHTVTEEVTGLDLVELQLRVAEGASLVDLGLAEPPSLRGSAIQLRICSERIDAKGRALPGAGEITRFEWPTGPGIRVDTALAKGLGPHPAFDSLMAKLIVHHPSPESAPLLHRARRALAEVAIEGPPENTSFLLALLERDEVTRNAITTAFVSEHGAELAEAAKRIAGRRELAQDTTTTKAPAARQETPPDGVTRVEAPLIGTVIELRVEPGAMVRAGETVCVLEAMKMEHVVAAPAAGRIDRVPVSVGDVLEEGGTIAWVRVDESAGAVSAAAAEIDLDATRPDLEQVRERHGLLLDESRPDAVERRRARGQRTARENLEALCDEGSFIEYGGLAVAAQRKARPIEELERRTPGDGIITGLATINADSFGEEAARCAVLVVDATVLAGTQGLFHHRKIDRLLELAEQRGIPVVFLPEGGGGRPNDTDGGDISAAGLTVTSFHAFARLSGKLPRVSVVSGYCFAGSAAFAGCADVIIATRNTSLGMGGPAMIEGGGLGVVAPEDVGPVSMQEPNGVIDLVVEDEVEGAAAARRYLSYFQGALPEFECEDQRTLRHLIPENRRRVYDVRRVIDALCDTGSVLELRRGWGVGMITALVRIEGRPLGLIANDPMHLGGAIDDEAAEKAARFLQLCDSFGLPVVSLCDTPGFMVGPEVEQKAQVRKVSRLFLVGATLSVPLFTVILRKGYGLGAQAMAGGSFVAPMFVISWPTGEIGGMGLEGAVRLGFQKQLAAVEDEAERNALFEKLVGVMYEKGKALHAASVLEFDAVIDPAETRDWILRALNAAGPVEPSGRMVDAW